MDAAKDLIDAGLEAFQFWRRFRGRRVRVWPADLTIKVCSESGKKWVTSAQEREPYWWSESRKRYIEDEAKPQTEDDELLRTLIKYAADNLTGIAIPHIETVEQAKLFEATLTDIVRQPPGLYFTDIQYWVVADDKEDKHVVKVDSSDEAIFLPFDKLARIDFVTQGPFVGKAKSSWE